jgi:hypothetical protein
MRPEVIPISELEQRDLVAWAASAALPIRRKLAKTVPTGHGH